MRRKKRWRKVVFVLGGLIGIWAALTVTFAIQYLRPTPLPSGPPPEYLSEVEVPHTGYTIPTWVTSGLDSGHGKGTVFVLVHGYGARRDDLLDLAGRLKPFGEVLLPAMAGQGPSHAKQVGFSVAESEELISCAEWAKKQLGPDTKVVLFGLSLGGGSSWTAAGKRPELFYGVVTDGAFARMDWATDDFMGTENPIRRAMSGPVIALATKMSGVKVKDIRPVDWAAKYHRRGLIIQGADDPMFGPRHAEALHKATGFEIWTVPGSGHAESGKEHMDELVSRILRVASINEGGSGG